MRSNDFDRRTGSEWATSSYKEGIPPFTVIVESIYPPFRLELDPGNKPEQALRYKPVYKQGRFILGSIGRYKAAVRHPIASDRRFGNYCLRWGECHISGIDG